MLGLKISDALIGMKKYMLLKPSFQRQVGFVKFQDSLIYQTNSRPARAVTQKPHWVREGIAITLGSLRLSF